MIGEELAVREIATYEDAELYGRIEEGRLLLAQMKGVMGLLEAEVSRRQERLAADLLRAAHKEHGTASFTDEDGRKFRAERKRTVKWDSAALQKIAATMPWQDVERVFDIDFSVSERVYNSVHSPELRAKLDTARTTKVGDLRVVYVGTDVGNGDSA